MKRLLACCAPSFVLLSTIAMAQQPIVGPQPGTPRQPVVTKIDRPPVAQLPTTLTTATTFVPQTLSAPPTTPEMWFYSQQVQRHDDPAQAVRRKAEFQAEQRMARLASLKWYGYSNSRPEAGVTPSMGTYSAGWIGNGGNRYDWVGGGYYYYWLY